MASIIIEPCSAKALPPIMKGHQISVVDVKGGQVADFIVFNLKDPRERLSQSQTMVFNGQTLSLGKGYSLYSTKQNKMMTIIEDSCGRHDIMHPPCNRKILRDYLSDGDRDGCEEHLTGEMEKLGIDPALLPYPFNVFQNTVMEGYRARVDPPISKAGDFVTLRSEMDCIVIVSSCAISSYGKKPIEIILP
jgi:uncharacterized protein YcgI (DUF1989 family)